ncbi:uncharacterized protein LOC125509143 [Triticum urartu]|nr:uncharacterized protein LOC119301364 [Triticum dicoccoides]XP_044381112.1 uncharacterized protein LOC123103558 [Triticum aestivum]XP_048530002.1 uncharacterized protein LOC125509143 [Triticum urartu]
MMGLQDTGSGRRGSFFQYQRLECRDDGATPRPRQRRWLPSLTTGKAACSCFFHLKKLRWSRITSVLLPRKVSEPSSSKIRHASVAHAEDACPSIVFLSQWGLPVLSGPSVAGNRGKHSRGKGY